MNDFTPWYILRTATRQEKRACESLSELQIEHYLPCETVERKLCRELTKVERALFPGYLFAQIPDRMFRVVIDADGVHAPVRVTTPSGERVPGRIPAKLVRELREAQANGDFDRTKKPEPKPILEGDTVLVVSGHFEGKLGAVIELRPKERVMLLLGGIIAEMAASEVAAA